MLSNVTETFALFKKENPDLQVGWTSFAHLRPRQCVLAGAGGTHSVCVCPMHENVKLAITGKVYPSLSFRLSSFLTDRRATYIYINYELTTYID